MAIIKTSKEWARYNMPKRPENSNKGSFGRLLAYVGSEAYRGAAYLALESALRGGAGYVELIGTDMLCDSILMKFPEIIFTRISSEEPTWADIENIMEKDKSASATLIGCGSGCSEALSRLTLSLIKSDGGPLIIDADAINSLAKNREEAISSMRSSEREIILTPHPLEFSRLTGMSVEEISSDRIGAAERFARDTEVTVILKGNGSVITDGKITYLNTSGSSALAKAGSGDCLAGLLASLTATRLAPAVILCALSAYIHGAAADELSSELSNYGVTPSDLPVEMAKVIKSLN